MEAPSNRLLFWINAVAMATSHPYTGSNFAIFDHFFLIFLTSLGEMSLNFILTLLLNILKWQNHGVVTTVLPKFEIYAKYAQKNMSKICAQAITPACA